MNNRIKSVCSRKYAKIKMTDDFVSICVEVNVCLFFAELWRDDDYNVKKENVSWK